MEEPGHEIEEYRERLATLGSCPVCGDELEADPRRCPRCETPHHPDCWEYVPGCAIFACASGGRPDTAAWPEAYRLVLRRVRLRRLAAWGAQVGVLAFAGFRGFGSYLPRGLHASLAAATPSLFLAFLATLVLVLVLDMNLTGRLAGEANAEVLALALEEGDTRLREQLRERAGSPAHLSALEATLLVWVGVAVGDALAARDLGSWVATQVAYAPYPWLVAFPIFRLSQAALGRPQLILNRLDASIARLDVKKPAGPTG